MYVHKKTKNPHVGEFEEDNLLQIGQDLLQLLLVVQQGVEEGHIGGHPVDLHPKVGETVIGHV